jgi:hypothetical protein
VRATAPILPPRVARAPALVASSGANGRDEECRRDQGCDHGEAGELPARAERHRDAHDERLSNAPLEARPTPRPQATMGPIPPQFGSLLPSRRV